MEFYKVHVAKDYLVFCAAHFITYDNGHACEALHGHNYRVRVTLEGQIGYDALVVDFVVLKRIMKRLTDTLDHKLILPLRNPDIHISEDGESLLVASKKKRYCFPQQDVVLLDITNTTAESLAKYLAQQLKAELAGLVAANLTAIEMEVEETFGQSGVYRETFSP